MQDTNQKNLLITEKQRTSGMKYPVPLVVREWVSLRALSVLVTLESIKKTLK